MSNRLSSFLPPPNFMRRPVPCNYAQKHIQAKKMYNNQLNISNTSNVSKISNVSNTSNNYNTSDVLYNSNFSNFSDNSDNSDNSNTSRATNSYTPSHFPTFFNTNEVIFELFGIKIFFDDILIICILFFLYEEGIQDEFLFISLVLLLLS